MRKTIARWLCFLWCPHGNRLYRIAITPTLIHSRRPPNVSRQASAFAKQTDVPNATGCVFSFLHAANTVTLGQEGYHSLSLLIAPLDATLGTY